MIGKTNVGGGGSAAWAVIGVTYPSGSTCTATDGTNTLTAVGTSGLYVFSIPEPDTTPVTWTVTCTNGSKTKSAQVVLDTQYQFVEVTLRYSRLPEGYQEVEYLESSGTQHINLGYTEGLSILEHTMTFMPLEYGNVAFGSNIAQVRIGWTESGSPGGVWYEYLENRTIVGNHFVGDKISVIVNNASSQIVEDGALIGTINGTGGSAILTMFGAYAGSVVANANVRIYEYKQKNLATDTLTYNLVPCYRTSDNVAGMLNLVDNTFLTNDGTGTFIVGVDV